ncbi:hypothetical protein L9F63_024644, partial [Diploptera punctata]
MKCSDRVPDEDKNKIFHTYWNLGEYATRVSYVASLMEVINKKTSWVRPDSNNIRHNRQVTVKYHLILNNGNVPRPTKDTCQTCDKLQMLLSPHSFSYYQDY